MKAKVIHEFIDKHTTEIHKVNDILEISEERFEEILTVGKLIEKVAEVTEEKPKGRKKKEEK